MHLAYTLASGNGGTDMILTALAGDLMARGLRLCGTVQINTERSGTHLCDMDMRVLPDGPVLRISQDLGPDARGCRLDPHALETAVGLVTSRLQSGADLMIVNKFGKHEAEGRGFRSVIAEAIALDIPILFGLNTLNRDAFEEFTGGFAHHLPPDRSALAGWVDEVMQHLAETA